MEMDLNLDLYVLKSIYKKYIIPRYNRRDNTNYVYKIQITTRGFIHFPDIP